MDNFLNNFVDPLYDPATVKERLMAASTSSSTHHDVAIVGAGCSGLYCAWRLAEEGGKSVVVFEKETRVGGRLLSIPLLKDGAPKAELGGMRFMKTQRLIYYLTQHLALNHEKFDYPLVLMYLRGTYLHAHDPSWRLP